MGTLSLMHWIVVLTVIVAIGIAIAFAVRRR